MAVLAAVKGKSGVFIVIWGIAVGTAATVGRFNRSHVVLVLSHDFKHCLARVASGLGVDAGALRCVHMSIIGPRWNEHKRNAQTFS